MSINRMSYEANHDTPPSVIANLEPSCTKLVLTGVTKEIMLNIPQRFDRLYLRTDITPAVMACIPPHIKYLYLIEPISADTLAKIPTTVKCAYFSNYSYCHFRYIDDKHNVLNTNYFLRTYPLKAIGVQHPVDISFLAAAPLSTTALHVQGAGHRVEFARELPPHFTKVLVGDGVDKAFIDAIPMHAEVVYELLCPANIKLWVDQRNTARNEIRVQYTKPAPKNLKRKLETPHNNSEASSGVVSDNEKSEERDSKRQRLNNS